MSGGISPNKLNDISKVYLDMVTDINKKEQEADAKRWTQKEETGCKTESPFKKKKVKEDYESQKKKEVLAAMKRQGRKLSSKDKNKIADKVVKDKGDTSKSDDRYAYEGFSDWRKDLREVTSDAEATDIDNQPEIKEKKVKNKIKINPEFKEAVKQMGGELLEVKEFSEDTEKYLTPNERAKYEAEKRKAVKKKKAKEVKKKKEEARRTAKGKQRATGNLRKHDADGDGYVKVIDAGYKPQGELLEVDDKKDPKADADAYKEKQMSDKEKKLKLRILRVKMMAAKQGADSSIVAHYEPDIEGAVEYFYEEGINEEGIEQLVEEIGLDEFVNFIEGGTIELNEERAARRATVRAKKYDVVKKEVDKADAARKASKKGEYAPSYAKKETDVTVYDDDKPAAKKKAAPAKKPAPAKKVAPAKKPAAPKKPVTKKVVKAVSKVKKTQPAKKVSKPGIRQKIATLYKRGVKRHRKATQPIRVLHKGMKQAPKAIATAAKKVKGVLDANKKKTVNMQSYEPEGDTLSEVQVTRVGDEQHKAMQDAVLKRKEDLKKKAKEKVKEEVVGEGKLTSIKATTYGMPDKERQALIDKERKRLGVKPRPTKKPSEVQEKVLDKFETGEKERIVKGMKKSSKDLKKRYGDKWKSVMYATATKKAKEAGDTSKSDKRYAYEETQIDELNRYEKEKGKSTGPAGTYRGGVNTPRKGTPTKKGGSSDKLVHFGKGLVRGAEGRPTGQTRRSYDDRGKEQDRKEKPSRTMERIRSMRKRADALMRDTSGT